MQWLAYHDIWQFCVTNGTPHKSSLCAIRLASGYVSGYVDGYGDGYVNGYTNGCVNGYTKEYATGYVNVKQILETSSFENL